MCSAHSGSFVPLNSSPVTTTAEALAQKLAAADGQLRVDCGFYGGVVPGNAEHIRPLVDAGVCAFKAFLCPSGIDEFPPMSEADLRIAMPILADALEDAGCDNEHLLGHCRGPGPHVRGCWVVDLVLARD